MAVPLQVGIDARCLNTPLVRGMGKYVLEMMAHAPDPDIGWRLFGDRPEAPLHRPHGVVTHDEIFDFKGYRFHTWEQIGLPLRARRTGVQVLHSTMTTLPYAQPMPTVVTVHDTLPWEGDDLQGYERWYWHRLMPAALARCHSIITISQASRDDIVARWPQFERKLHVIPHGVADAYLRDDYGRLPETLQAQIGAEPYFLYIGGAVERKRFAWAATVVNRVPGAQLVACGFREDEAAAARRALAPEMQGRTTFLSYMAEEDMPLLYANAVAVLYPTLYEGFGFPALEAQAVGVPVLFSPLGSLKELAGPLAEILPPEDLAAWVAVAVRVLGLHGKRSAAHADAKTWAEKFSWDISARRHVEVYRAAARLS